MVPFDMTIMHDPPNAIGDCFRCCIASIMEVPPRLVPHFYEGEAFTDETGRIGRQRLYAWLKPFGYFYFEVEFEEPMVKNWIDYLDCHYVFSGATDRGTRHATVGYRGEMIHDPHPSRSGVMPDDGKYLFGFIVKR